MHSKSSRQFRRLMRWAALLVMGHLLLVVQGEPAGAAGGGAGTPYFAALKADKVHVRKGPGRSYDISWTYHSLGLPVEVTGSHEHWRRVRDSTGAEGWVYFRLLSALRMALVSPWQKKDATLSLHNDSRASSSIIAKLEPGVKVLLKSCTGKWCHVSVKGFTGWMEQAKLWGAYPGEVFK